MTDYRQDKLSRIVSNPNISVLIIGAGINGVGTFRDLALQGVDVLMIDKGDFCSGASMASSHMLHGGIRYLENGEFRLVKEALRERNRLLRNAPHLAKPLPTTIPIYKRFSGLLNAPLKFLGLMDKPSERGAFVIKVGLMLYDFYVRGDSPMPGHKFRNREQTLNNWPALNPDIIYTATYFDGAMHSPERITIELLMDGEADGELVSAVNYMRITGVDGNKVSLQDQMTGELYSIYPEIIINAAGPWIDITNRELGVESKFIGGTKGSHIIIDHPELREAIKDNEIFFEYYDGRIVLINPYLDKVMIGTMDIRIENPDGVNCTDTEIDYMLNMVPHVFPNISVTKEHIIFEFSGVRPLPVAKGTTGQISRDHSVEVIEPNVNNPFPILNLIGGKWTTYRAFSEDVSNRTLSRLGKDRNVSTADLPIGGGVDYPETEHEKILWIDKLAQNSILRTESIKILFERYGTHTSRIIDTFEEGDEKQLKNHTGYLIGEIRYIVRYEMVVHLDDLFLRRSLLAWLGELNYALLEELSDITGDVLGWTEEQKKTEVERSVNILIANHHARLDD